MGPGKSKREEIAKVEEDEGWERHHDELVGTAGRWSGN